MKWTLTTVTRPSDIYRSRTFVVERADGYNIVDFRPPKLNELLLSPEGLVIIAAHNYEKTNPRFILQPSQKRFWWE